MDVSDYPVCDECGHALMFDADADRCSLCGAYGRTYRFPPRRNPGPLTSSRELWPSKEDTDHAPYPSR